uniref:Fatty acyl-CoA reductase n=1 Tax=Stomoxys calcitrans TaxID=35570 RepID=A0A1I8PGQ9_STOCA
FEISGIVGKAVIEKLLRSCNVRKIFVLLRPKKNFTIAQRLDTIKKEKIFRRLMSEKPNEFHDKVVPIPGDVELPLLGIKPEHAQLMANVSIVIHSAATVRFDESLRDAIRLNVGGTLENLKFSETLKNLEVFMHVSTFFSNPYLEYVEAKVYESAMDWRFCLDLCRREDITDDMIDVLTRKLIVGFPNTYCFTKNLAESMVNYYGQKLPVAIFRPSIVVQAVEEPEPGFPPSLTGAMAVFVAASVGIMKAIPMPRDQFLDLSPQDITVKTLLYYIMKTGMEHATNESADVPVFNLSVYGHSPINFPEYIEMADEFWNSIPVEKGFLAPGVTVTENIFRYMFLVIFKQILPAFFLDLLLKIIGQKPVMMKIQRKIFNALKIMRPFVANNYRSSGVSYAKDMIKELNGTDFNVDVFVIMKSTYAHIGYTRDMICKCREILLKEDPSTIPRSRLIVKGKILLYRAFQLFVAYKIYCRWIYPMTKEWHLDLDWNINNNTTRNESFFVN